MRYGSMLGWGFAQECQVPPVLLSNSRLKQRRLSMKFYFRSHVAAVASLNSLNIVNMTGRHLMSCVVSFPLAREQLFKAVF